MEGEYCLGLGGFLVIYMCWLFVGDEMGSLDILTDEGSGERGAGCRHDPH